jgi:hypothetical protein
MAIAVVGREIAEGGRHVAEKQECLVKKEKSPSTEGLLIAFFSPRLQRSFGLGL